MSDQLVREPERDSRTIPRRRFLRRVGTTLAAGIGLALVPANAAWAPCSSCCPDNNCNLPGCNKTKYRCQPGNCCICHTNVGCFSTQVCYCP